MGFKFFSPGARFYTSEYLEYINAILQEVCVRGINFFNYKIFLGICEDMYYYSDLLMFTVTFL